MDPVGFELTTPVFERAKTVHALDRAATVIGMLAYKVHINVLAKNKNVLWFYTKLYSAIVIIFRKRTYVGKQSQQ
jgi:hypothetical protein